MTKQELTRDIKSTFNGAGLIGVKEISQFTSLESKAVRRMMAGTEYCTLGKKRLYTIGDVADVLMRLRG